MKELLERIEMLGNEMKENKNIMDDYSRPLKERMVAIDKFYKAKERLDRIEKQIDMTLMIYEEMLGE